MSISNKSYQENITDKVQVETMSTKKILFKTLNDLSSEELEEFKSLIELEKRFPPISKSRLKVANTQDIVELLVETYSQDCVELTRKVLKEINRADLVQWLSDIGPGTKEKHSVDKQRPSLIQREETMVSVIELLLETLADLSDGEFTAFNMVLLTQIHIRRRSSDVGWRLLDRQDTVFLMVQIYGRQSVEMTKEVLKEIERTDLVQRLSYSSSSPKKKPSADGHCSALIQKVATIAAVKQLLLETLNDLSYKMLEEFREFLQMIVYQKNLPDISWMVSYTADTEETVDLMVQTYGQQSVELTMEVFMDMNRPDLMQRLSEAHSALKEKHLSKSFQKEVTETSKQKLLETIIDLSYEEFEQFKWFLQHPVMKKGFPRIQRRRLEMANRAEMVELMVEIYGQQSVELTMEVLSEMNRSDLVQRLSKPISEKNSAEVIVVSVKEKLLETLEDLGYGEFEQFKWFLQHPVMKKGLPRISKRRLEIADRAEMVELMVEIYGRQSVELTMEVLSEMNRSDLVQRLSKPISEKNSAEVIVASVKEKLLETLEDLGYGEFEQFKWFLQHPVMKKGLPRISERRLEIADRAEMVELMVEIYGQQSVELTMEVLSEMNRSDLVQRLSERGPSRSLELEGCGSIMDSSDWTKLEPEVNSTDADEAPTYSLQSEAGRFECSVSDLRWVCKEQVSFKYRLCSWEDHMERMESIEYMPAGPLIDITVIAGKLFEVYLPHWICIDDNPKILDKFAVLHIDDCGDVVEKVTEVTPSHVKLSEPIFSPRAALMKVGFPLKIYCNVLIYKTNIAFLTLHVYLIPCDPGLQQIIDKMELSDGYKIRKPHPEKSLKIRDKFILTADLDDAEISPKKLKLRHNGKNQNFCEVFIENPDRDFTLQLTQENELQPVWTCTIRKDEYHSTGHMPEKHSVDELLSVLMQKATITKDRERLLKTLEHLKQEELKEFKWFLRDRDIGEGLPCIPRKRLDESDMLDLVDLMMQTYSQQCVEVTKKVFKKIQRNDLVQMLSD